METIKNIAQNLVRAGSNGRPPIPARKHSPSGNGKTLTGQCETCQSLGYYKIDVPVGHPDFGQMLLCECRSQERVAQLASLSGLKPHESQRLDALTALDQDAAGMLRLAWDFVKEPHGWLYLWGGPGNGKSLVLQAVVNEMTMRGIPAVYVTFADLLDLVRETFKPQAEESYQARFRRLQLVPVLAIDEFDKVNETEFVREFRSKLVDHRYRDAVGGQTATLFASNAAPEALPDWLYSRVNDGRFTVYHNAGGDVRPTAEWGDL